MTKHTVPDRLRRYVATRLGPDVVDRLQALLAENIHDGQDAERILTAIVLAAGEDGERLEEAVALAGADWRDVLVAAGLAGEDWPERLARHLA